MNDENKKLNRYIITFQNDDSTTTKYVISRPNFYEAKQEAIGITEEVNSTEGMSYRIKSYDVKEENSKKKNLRPYQNP